MVSIVWFRQDLRLADNPALSFACAKGPAIPVYVLEEFDGQEDGRPIGSASQWWLAHSLNSLCDRLGGLVCLRGDPQKLLLTLAEKCGATGVYWNRRYEPASVKRDTAVKQALKEKGYEVQSFKGALIAEPWDVENKQGKPFKVYSPFWRTVRNLSVEAPLPVPKIKLLQDLPDGEDVSDWGLSPTAPNWAAGWESIWTPGETGAQERLDQFIGAGLEGYATLRDRPDRDNVSRLSAHLHYGEISPRQVWTQVAMAGATEPRLEADANKFLSELGWREFSYHLLYHFPELPDRNWRTAFDAYPWNENPGWLKAWQRGLTGYPLVDAGMRELWQTGFMHNRVRMVVASFLIKHLRLDWRLGESWFWDTLVDADLANNAASWQWVAGSGADAAPYFRIFNPITQGRKFDPNGAYVRQWCPELSRLDARFIHAPFEAPSEILAAAGLELGRDYPAPIVDHSKARALALEGYEAVKELSGG